MNAPAKNSPDLAEPLRSRWSPSVFDAQHTLSIEQITTLLHAAQWSPSLGNTQPWTFIVAERGSAAHDQLVPRLSRGNSGWVPRASVVFITATQVELAPGQQEAKLSHTLYDLGQAAAHLTLQARAMGLHAHQFAGFERDEFATAVGVPPHYRVMSGIAVGVPGDPGEVSERDAAREVRPRTRRALSEWAFGPVWGTPWGPA